MNETMRKQASGAVYNAKIVTETGVCEHGAVVWREGIITYVGPWPAAEGKAGAADGVPPVDLGGNAVDAGGCWVLPGFIDLHVHGGYGADFMDASADAYDTITAFHAKHGTTGLLATTVTAGRPELDRVFEAASAYRHTQTAGAELYGVHLEGPFISPKWPGAQNPAHIAPPAPEWLQEWARRYPGLLRMVTLAPERPGALEAIQWLASTGIIAACGHTDATYEDIQAAAGHGLSHAVHAFNAMRGLHHREPGTAGAVLTDPRISAEVIADGLHVHPACVRLLAQVKRQHNYMLITDAISAAGMGDGDYSLGGLDVVVKDGAARLKEGGSLAGSTLTMIDAFRNVIRMADLSVQEASELASANPARKLGVYGETGSVSTGKKANLLMLTPELDLRQVWIGGAEQAR